MNTVVSATDIDGVAGSFSSRSAPRPRRYEFSASTTRKFMQYLPWDEVDECMDAAIVLSNSRLPDDIFNVFREFCMDQVRLIERTCPESVQ